MAEVGDIFDGRYTDPNHPDGYRWISFGDQIEDDKRAGSCVGSDTGHDKQEYDLPASASGEDEITVDFSPKGGPADFKGVWDEVAFGIKWSDGNMWPRTDKIDPKWCPEQRKEELLQ